jgi:EmrB/QacA subfamily drug resistance transporter
LLDHSRAGGRNTVEIDIRTVREPVGSGGSSAPRRLGLALIVIAAAQLLVVLDATIVNIALPSIEHQFRMGGPSLAWIVNAYALAFGGFMLLGGRAGDLYGRRRVFRIGLAAFAGASLLGGLAPNEHLLIAARVVQGLGGAVIAPNALALIATNFPQGPVRSKAMGVYAAVAGIGATIGLLLGGVLTDYLSWRWVLFVNVPIAAAVLLGSRVLAEGDTHVGRLDIPGSVTGTGGLVALVYGITRAGQAGWTNTWTLLSFTAAVVLLTAFLVLQGKVPHPILPLRLLRDRNRSGAYITMFLVGSAMLATFYFLTLYMQQVLGYSPVKTGLSYLPLNIGMMIAAGVVVPRLIGRIAPRILIVTGTFIGAGGMFWFSFLTPSASYRVDLLPAMVITGIGLGTAFLPLPLAALAGTTERDAGIASALLNSGELIGGALGLAVLATVATAASDSRLPHAVASFYRALDTHNLSLAHHAADAMTHGYTIALGAAALALIAAGLVALALIDAPAVAPAEIESKNSSRELADRAAPEWKSSR